MLEGLNAKPNFYLRELKISGKIGLPDEKIFRKFKLPDRGSHTEAGICHAVISSNSPGLEIRS